MVESLRAQARIEAVLVDNRGVAVVRGARPSVLSPKIARAVLLRDGHCRWPGCERRTGLQIHHLTPRSWGGGDDLANLAAICTGGGTDHHTRLVPHGPWQLAGNPNRPDGLHLERLEQRVGAHDARAGP
jgi:5-methylcytosine-specific restriction endonuclease McrA